MYSEFDGVKLSMQLSGACVVRRIDQFHVQNSRSTNIPKIIADVTRILRVELLPRYPGSQRGIIKKQSIYSALVIQKVYEGGISFSFLRRKND